VIPIEFFAKVKAIADVHGIPVHLDGARLLNAAVALKVTPKSLAEHADSINLCLSKGIGAPMGSVLVGSKVLIERALRMRKALGGGWRKAGILAAAGLEAMKGVEARLLKDHTHALMFAEGVSSDHHGVVHVDVAGVQSNMVVVDILKPGLTAVDVCARLARVTEQELKDTKQSIVLKTGELTKYTIRFVTLSDVSELDVKLAVAKMCYVLKQYSLN